MPRTVNSGMDSNRAVGRTLPATAAGIPGIHAESAPGVGPLVLAVDSQGSGTHTARGTLIVTPLSRLLPEVHWDRPAERWRVTVGEEPIAGEDGQPLGWDCFNDAYDVMVRMQREASVQHPAELARTAARPPVPEVGTWVVDTRSDRTAMVTDVRQGRLYLRPPGWGAEWEAMPVHVRLATEREAMSARLSELNQRSRTREWS